MWRAALGLAGLVAACGPVTRQDAERECYSRVQKMRPVSGEARFGANSQRGLVGEIDLTLSMSSDQGRDPSQVYDSCVYQKSGQLPSQPLYTRPDWKG